MGNEEFQQSSKSSSDEHGIEKSEKKSQDSLKLIDSQENIFHKVFEIFSQSSLSTNVGDFDVLLSEAEKPVNEANTKPQPSSTYDLRSRTITKQQTKKYSDTAQNLKRRKHKPQRNPSTADIDPNDIEMETCSQKSISMLQACYKDSGTGFPELLEPCINLDLDMVTDEEYNDWNDFQREEKTTVESSTQTEFPLLLSGQREMEITKHTKFVGCIVRLKAILSSKDKRVDGQLHDVLREITESEAVSGKNPVLSKETLGYVLRSSDTENVLRETVQALLFHFDNMFKEDFLLVAACWRHSVYEMAVDMLQEAVDADQGIRKMMELFLSSILESITNNEERSKNLLLESKTAIVMSFCKSTYLSVTSIQYIIGQLKRLKTKPQGHFSLSEKLSWSNLVKNFYFLLRILEVCLETIRSKLGDRESDGVLKKEREVKNFNVLEMWKKHWREEERGNDVETGCQWKLMISRWCDELDEVLATCVNHFPISAMAVERCKCLLMDISQICHSDKKNEFSNFF